jgi:hypothetical protein
MESQIIPVSGGVAVGAIAAFATYGLIVLIAYLRRRKRAEDWFLAAEVIPAIAALGTSALAGYIAIAAAFLIARQIAPDRVAPLAVDFVPQFVLIVCAQLAVLHAYYRRNISVTARLIAQLQTRALGSGDIRTFAGPKEFHDYLRVRFELARVVQVTHFSAGTNEITSDDYRDIVAKFVERDGIFRRVVVDTLNREVWERQRDFMAAYGSKSAFLHYLPEVVVQRIKLMDIMLIDDGEVCLGGGYSIGYQYPTITIRHPEVVAFFVGYYKYLREKATNVKIDPYGDLEILDGLIDRESRTLNRGNTPPR